MNEATRVRLSIVGVIVLALFSTLLARLWFLQVASGSDYAEAAQSNRTRVIEEPGQRGRILDRNGVPIVDNTILDTVKVERGLTDEERATSVEHLSQLTGQPEGLIEARLDDKNISPYASVPMTFEIKLQHLVYIDEHPEEFPGVESVRLPIRSYPYGDLAAHVLGYMGEVNEDQLEYLKAQGYEPGDRVGRGGIEQTFESVLRGTPYQKTVEVDAQGRVVNTIDVQQAKSGHDVWTTLDLEVQRVAEESLDQGMAGAQGFVNGSVETELDYFDAPGGSVVVLDARTGGVVAMASNPTYSPEELANGISPQSWEELQGGGTGKPFVNRAIQGQYAPGSTFKLFSGLAGRESGVLFPGYTWADDGCIDLDDGTQRCNAGKIAHGAVDLPRALSVSSDTFFYVVGFNLWTDFYDQGDEKTGEVIQHVARRYGFGERTGFALSGEQPGRVPDDDFKADFNAENPDPVTREWLPGDNISLATGQGDLLVTPLQLANAYAAFANGETLWAPQIATEVAEPGGDVISEIEPKSVRELEIDPATRTDILEGLKGAVGPGDGTAAAAFSGYEFGQIAGKTGTAQVNDKGDTSLFVGITPADPASKDVPQYVVAVLVEEAGFGASVAAPIARRIIDTINGVDDGTPVQVIDPDGGYD
ncbi:MAG: penicillin-binding protein 2 [Acidimicrobiia bacterium]